MIAHSHFWQIVFMFVVLFFLFGLSIFMKKKIESSTAGGMKIKSILHLGRKEKIILAEVDGQQILLGVTPYQINFIQAIVKNEKT